MLGNSFDDRKDEVFSFIDEVKKRRAHDDAIREINNRPEVKLRKLDQAKEDGVNQCLNIIFGKLYQKSLPVNCALPNTPCINGSIKHLPNPSELSMQMSDFVKGRCDGNTPTYYVNEAIKRTNSQALKQLMEGCQKIVSDQYYEKSRHPEMISDEDYNFKLSDESEGKLNDLMDQLQLDDLSDIIKDNVRKATISEIEAAKKEKSERKELEDELANNDNIATESALDDYLRRIGENESKIYQPSLFGGIMTAKFNQLPYTENVNNDIITDVDLMTEGALEKVRRLFMSKKDRELQDDFKTYQGAYGRLLGMYKSEVLGNDHNQIVSNCKMALTSNRVSPKVTFMLPDMKESEHTLQTVADEHKAVLRDPKNNKGNTKAFSTPKKKYELAEALKQYQTSVKYLQTYFKDPNKINDQTEKYEKIEAGATRQCENTKELKRVRDAISGLLTVETTRVMLHMQFVKGVVECSKTIAKEASRMSVKESAFEEAVKEYTMLSCIKALRLEDFSMQDTKNMANNYAKYQY
nr:MAG TPA: hypothetical protein [Caudoviricetes sp.]